MGKYTEDYKVMPDTELRKIYKKYIRIQRMLAGFPLVFLFLSMFFFGLMGWVDFLGFEMSGFKQGSDNPLGIIYIAAFAFYGITLILPDKKAHKTIFIGIIGLYAVLIAVTYFMGAKYFIPIEIICVIYSVCAHIAVVRVVEELNLLRQLPTFPFLYEHRKMMNENSLTRTQMLNYLENADDNSCKALDYDKILDGDFETHKPKEPDKSEFFQQHNPYR